jgi:hypothetical protein
MNADSRVAMSQYRLLVRLMVFFLFPSLSAQSQQIPENRLQARVRITSQSLMTVPVVINGIGPYDFLLDTGTTETTVDQKLAAEIGLSTTGRTTIVSIQGGETTMFTAAAESVSVAGSLVHNLTLGVVKSLASAPAKVRGILGEDFLSNFDLLLDYQHRYVQFDPKAGSLAGMLTGEHVPVDLLGHDHFGAIKNRLILAARITELTPTPVKLLLDSGTNVAVLFGPRLHLPDPRGSAVYLDGNSVSSATIIAGNWQRVGQITLGDSTAVSLPTLVIGAHIMSDVEGLLPTSAFHSIFISHSGEFVILNPRVAPSLPRAFCQWSAQKEPHC